MPHSRPTPWSRPRQNWWSRLRGSLTLLVTWPLLTSYGCSSTPAQINPPPGPPSKRLSDPVLRQEGWLQAGTMITLPYEHLREITASRRRWIAYGEAWALQVPKKKEDE